MGLCLLGNNGQRTVPAQFCRNCSLVVGLSAQVQSVSGRAYDIFYIYDMCLMDVWCMCEYMHDIWYLDNVVRNDKHVCKMTQYNLAHFQYFQTRLKCGPQHCPTNVKRYIVYRNANMSKIENHQELIVCVRLQAKLFVQKSVHFYT